MNMLRWMLVSSISAVIGCIYFLINIEDNNFGVVFWLFSWMVLYIPMMWIKKDKLRDM